MTTAIVSTAIGEVLHQGNPKPVVSTAVTEVLHQGTAVPKVSTVRLEVLRSINNLVVLSHRRVTVVVTGL